MLFPLGLGFKLRRFPLVTVVLTAICIGIYAWQPHQSENNLKRVEKILKEENFIQYRLALFVDYCVSRGGEKGRCQEMADLVGDKAANKPAPRDNKMLENLHDSLFYITLTFEFAKKLKAHDPVLLNLPSYQAYSQSMEKVRDKLADFYNTHNLLSGSNINLKAAVTSLFLHQSLGHLVGNMLFLLLFGAYVEQRIGPVLYLTTYFVGGLTGMVLEVLLMRESIFFVVGASASISAIMGMFFVLYFRFRMRFLVWYMTGKTFYAPVQVIFPILYIGQELVSGLGGSDGIAHFAHLGGLAVGMYFAFLWDSFNPVPWPFIYPAEQSEFAKLKNIKVFGEKFKFGMDMLSFNGQNSAVRNFLINETLLQLRDQKLADSSLMTFLKDNLSPAIEEMPKKSRAKDASALLINFPWHFKLAGVWRPSDASVILQIGDHYLKDDHYVHALRMYDYYLVLSTKSRKASGVLMTSREVLKAVAASVEMSARFEEYLRWNQPSALAESFQTLVKDQPVLNLGVDDALAIAKGS